MNFNQASSPSPDQPFGNIMPMIFMSQMLNDENKETSASSHALGDDFFKMLMFSNMMNGSNPFEFMFPFSASNY